MVQFKKLRLHGFKSFVDSTDMEIGAGMTGIIGPNGCGKSNLVEALRWAMGETSAKRMRGTGMEDVIFNGTSNRPAKNSAEVTLWVDNSDRKAPAELNHSDELEILRRIEKDSGSTYKVNGKTVRARDVQILFADSSIGANSPALVSQGRVADLINAKPTQRRLILEEAAGVSGLHARRHEAELKLRAAENNLLRLEDVIGTMESQLGGLKKQARQATRYRNLSTHIQRAEATLLYQKWDNANTAALKARQLFDAAEQLVREQMQIVSAQTTSQTDTGSLLPELRRKEAEAAAKLQHFRIALNNLKSEAQQVAEKTEQAQGMLDQSSTDIAHENQQKAEAITQIDQLKEEKEKLEQESGQYDGNVETAETEKDTAYERVQSLDSDLAAIVSENASLQAQKSTCEQQIGDIERRLEQLNEKLAAYQEELSELQTETPAQQRLDALEGEIATAEATLETHRTALEQAESHKSKAEEALQEKRQEKQEKQNNFTHLEAEVNAINKLLSLSQEDDFEPILEQVKADDGYEQALAVALGDDLQASLDQEAPISWQELPPLSSDHDLPSNCVSLVDKVKAPKALQRRLSQIGVVENGAAIHDIVPQLKAGQSLVSLDGAAWRWDGLIVKADAQNPAAHRLEQKNRLGTLLSEQEALEKDVRKASEYFEKSKEALSKSNDEIQQKRQELREAEQALQSLRQEQNRLSQDLQQTANAVSTCQARIENTKEELETASERLTMRQDELTAMPDLSDNQDKIDTLRGTLDNARLDLSEKQTKYATLRQEAQNRAHRLSTVTDSLENWENRFSRFDERIANLQSRHKEAHDVITTLADKPAEIEAKQLELIDQIDIADKKRGEVAAELSQEEMKAHEIQRELKSAEEKLATAREERAMAQATVSNAEHTRTGLEEQIMEKFSCPAHSLLSQVDIDIETTDLPDIQQTQAKLEKLIRERDNMGPVNLRADIEAQELVTEMDTMETEKEDLVSAINKLRHGIGRLNKEARERLTEAFDKVNFHFQDLFTQLFGGGKAYLELVDDPDPLKAGLEIYAQPPGKKLQVLSLFSGGEQTLTSIALIFAMFLTNPAPICVLDEIDAPLDDSNVDRVCSLLEQLAKTTETRFIVISHHRMTMARMDRLYGVTMSERGVSQLVSVDLQQHEMILDAAE